MQLTAHLVLPPLSVDLISIHVLVLSFAVKKKPTMYDLKFNYNVVEGVEVEWEELAYALIFETPAVNAIKRNTHSVKAACTDMLSKWLEGKGERGPRNWDTLLKALTDIEKHDLVQEIRQKL